MTIDSSLLRQPGLTVNSWSWVLFYWENRSSRKNIFFPLASLHIHSAFSSFLVCELRRPSCSVTPFLHSSKESAPKLPSPPPASLVYEIIPISIWTYPNISHLQINFPLTSQLFLVTPPVSLPSFQQQSFPSYYFPKTALVKLTNGLHFQSSAHVLGCVVPDFLESLVTVGQVIPSWNPVLS